MQTPRDRVGESGGGLVGAERGGRIFRAAGVACLVVSGVLAAAGLVWFVSGFEPAFVLIIAGFGGVVLGIGLLTAARRAE